MTSVAVIGDIHGNARALRAALERADEHPVDQLVFMGDLLTYGHDVHEVLDIVQQRRQAGATVLLGNHDQMYFDILDGKRDYFDRLPDWIKHSVEKTIDVLSAAAWRAMQFSQEHIRDGVLFAHANPFGGADWTYLNAAEHHERAAYTLEARGLRGGVFGHTHRARWYVGDPSSATTDVALSTGLAATTTFVANAGAVGQPRDHAKRSVMLRLSIESDRIEGTFEPVSYDVSAHIAELYRAGLPLATTEKLCAFFTNAT